MSDIYNMLNTKTFSSNEFLLLCYVLRCRMCSGVVTLSVYTTPGKLKNQPDHGGNRTRNLWFASPMLYQLSYEVKSVRVFDIPKYQTLEPT